MKSCLCFFIFLTVGLLPSFAHAQIIPVSRLSSVRFNSSTIESTSFDPFAEMFFDSGSPLVDQNSMFDNQVVSVNTELQNIGTSNVGGGEISASSRFELVFDLSDSSVFQLTGLLTESDAQNFGESFVRLDGPTSFDFQSIPGLYSAPTTTSIDEFFLLPSGRYTLEIGSLGFGNDVEPVADSSAAVTFQFVGTAVPEPSSTFVLFATCIPLLVRRKH